VERVLEPRKVARERGAVAHVRGAEARDLRAVLERFERGDERGFRACVLLRRGSVWCGVCRAGGVDLAECGLDREGGLVRDDRRLSTPLHSALLAGCCITHSGRGEPSLAPQALEVPEERVVRAHGHLAAEVLARLRAQLLLVHEQRRILLRDHRIGEENCGGVSLRELTTAQRAYRG
jgi:hypothetical protein